MSREYELKKVGCRQDKDGGWLVTLRIHIEDRDSALVLAPAGTVFAGPLREEFYLADDSGENVP